MTYDRSCRKIVKVLLPWKVWSVQVHEMDISVSKHEWDGHNIHGEFMEISSAIGDRFLLR